jgi:hypothetical protein
MNTPLAHPEPKLPRGMGVLLFVALLGMLALVAGVSVVVYSYLPGWELPLALVCFLVAAGLMMFRGRRLARTGYPRLIRTLRDFYVILLFTLSSSDLVAAYVDGLAHNKYVVKLAALLPVVGVAAIQSHYHKAWMHNLRQRAAKATAELMEQLTPEERAEVMEEMAAEEEGAAHDDDAPGPL